MKITFNYAGTPFTIRVDANQYTLAKVVINTDKKSKNFGKESESDLGYFPKVEQAIDKIMKVGMSNEVDEISYGEFKQFLLDYKDELTKTLSIIKK